MRSVINIDTKDENNKLIFTIKTTNAGYKQIVWGEDLSKDENKFISFKKLNELLKTLYPDLSENILKMIELTLEVDFLNYPNTKYSTKI